MIWQLVPAAISGQRCKRSDHRRREVPGTHVAVEDDLVGLGRPFSSTNWQFSTSMLVPGSVFSHPGPQFTCDARFFPWFPRNHGTCVLCNVSLAEELAKGWEGEWSTLRSVGCRSPNSGSCAAEPGPNRRSGAGRDLLALIFGRGTTTFSLSEWWTSEPGYCMEELPFGGHPK